MEKVLYGVNDFLLIEILKIQDDDMLMESMLSEWIEKNFDTEEKIQKNIRRLLDLIENKKEDYIRKVIRTVLAVCIAIGSFAIFESFIYAYKVNDIHDSQKSKVVKIAKDEITKSKKSKIFNLKTIEKPIFKSYKDLEYAVGKKESSNRWDIVNSSGYMGYFQMGKSALQDIGIPILNDEDKEAFLNNPNIQRKAFKKLLKRNKQILNSKLEKGFDYYDGRTIGGVKLSKSGMLMGSHLVGAGAMSDFINSNGRTIAKDGNNVPITEYIALFADYHIPFI